MMNTLISAIDAALSELRLNKICHAVEDEDAYYFTGCSDNGEGFTGGACVSVDKGTMLCQHCAHDDPCWNTPKRKIEIPKERSDVFMKQRIYYGIDNEYYELDNDE